MDRLDQLIARIDQLNSQDPNTELVGQAQRPRELAAAQRLSEWVMRLDPGASEALRIAARGQHVQRWTIPRGQYPMTRAGYLKWRETLKAFHIETVAALMREVGYSDAMVARVAAMMSKRQLAEDRDTQTLEDALCLVFLETQLADLAQKIAEDKLQDVLRKTWAKMSPQGRQAALQLPMSPPLKAIVVRAVAS